MSMRWLGRACPHCGGSLYYGTDKKVGYKGNKWLAKCINCSRIVPIQVLRRVEAVKETAQ